MSASASNVNWVKSIAWTVNLSGVPSVIGFDAHVALLSWLMTYFVITLSTDARTMTGVGWSRLYLPLFH